MHRSSRNIGDETDEIKTPHRRVAPRIADIFECRRLFKCNKSLCRIISENSLSDVRIYRIMIEEKKEYESGKAYIDHYNFFAFTIPWFAP